MRILRYAPLSLLLIPAICMPESASREVIPQSDSVAAQGRVDSLTA
ncbi:MAG: hypothetical protein H7066_10205, partial [Cytophagaceae bacterium]|nr:hypothetical protein [Gemmatimonadaceae bacterium]